MYGCICGRTFASKSARTRHCNQCSDVRDYRERVEARMARENRPPAEADGR